MNRSIDLPEDVFAALEEAATASGTTPVEWIAARLPQSAPAVEPECEGQSPRTLADELAGRVGLLASGPPIPEGTPTPAERFAALVGGFRSERGDLAERHSELFMEGLLEKRRLGHL
jgi:hypothetical protein